MRKRQQQSRKDITDAKKEMMSTREAVKKEKQLQRMQYTKKQPNAIQPQLPQQWVLQVIQFLKNQQ